MVKFEGQATPAWYCSSLLTLLTPTEEPWLAGFTNSGRPSFACISAKGTAIAVGAG
jgi:hypothetical protein